MVETTQMEMEKEEEEEEEAYEAGGDQEEVGEQLES